MNKFYWLIAVVFLLNACKQEDTKTLLCKKWKTIRLQNTKMDASVREMDAYIDTVGSVDKDIQEVIDLDSFKNLLRANANKLVAEQKQAMENTTMDFKQNGVVYSTSIAGTDSANWTLDKNYIKIDEAALKGTGETMTFEIMNINKDSIVLRVIDYGDTSVATMKPAL
jgi:hypothetical protein